jgi:hypothetical protein
MSSTQRFVMEIVPRRWAADIEAQSRSWMARCPCGHEMSIWELGGIRWKARGTPTRMMACPACSTLTPHKIYRKTDETSP